jgi:hypothetical protein
LDKTTIIQLTGIQQTLRQTYSTKTLKTTRRSGKNSIVYFQTEYLKWLCNAPVNVNPRPPNRGGGGVLAGKVVSFDCKYVTDDGGLGQHFLFR